MASDLPYLPALPAEVRFEGTVKLHGTHIAIAQARAGAEVQVPSRNRKLSKAADNLGSWDFVHQRLPAFQRLLKKARTLAASHDEAAVVLHGELAGRGVQARVGVNQVDRFVALFAVSVDGAFQDFGGFGDLRDEASRVFNVRGFGTFEVTMDTRDPLACEDEVRTLTAAVGDACPAALALGASGKGEGIVWTCRECESTRLWFKSKADGFDVRPPKAPVPTDAEDFSRFVTPARLEQGLDHLRERGAPETIHSISLFTRWVVKDVLDEEGKLLSSAQAKAAAKGVARQAGAWFRSRVL
jgi:hypothetical protein